MKLLIKTNMKDKYIVVIPMYDKEELVGIIKTNGAGSFQIYKTNEFMSSDELADFMNK